MEDYKDDLKRILSDLDAAIEMIDYYMAGEKVGDDQTNNLVAMSETLTNAHSAVKETLRSIVA